MTNLGIGLVVILGVVLLCLVIQAIRISAREFANRVKQWQLCESHRCVYYTDYLKKGPADLSHSQYHEAVNAHKYWTDSMDEWEGYQGRGGVPTYTARMIQLYRIQARL